MTIKALDSKINLSMFFKGMANRLQNILAESLTAEEKLALIQEALEKDVAEKRVAARTSGAAMRALSDPETKELEPLDAMKARRSKLEALGGANMSDPTKLASIANELKGLDALIAANQETYDTLAEAYGLDKENYKAALEALEKVKNQGAAVLMAIKAHQTAMAARDASRNKQAIDTSFIDQLTGELNTSRAAARTDADIDADLDSINSYSANAELEATQAKEVDADILARFQAAADKNAPQEERKTA